MRFWGGNVLSPTPLTTSQSSTNTGTSSTPAPTPAPTATTTPTRIISLSGNLAFGTDTVGSSDTETLTITNTGNSRLTWTDISTGLSVITASPTSGSVKAGGSKKVTLTFSPVAAITYLGEVTVTSNNTSGKNRIAVSGTGTTPALTPAPTCYASSAGCDPTPQSIMITMGKSLLTSKNETSQITATIQNSNGSTQDVTASATWATSSPDVASVSSGGLVTALANGTTTIQATSQGKTDSVLITVAMKATPQATYEYAYYCSPTQFTLQTQIEQSSTTYEAGVDVTITEVGLNIGMTVTSVVVRMYDYGGMLQVDKTLSASEIASQWGGSNHFGPGETRIVHYQSAFPNNIHPEDGTADVTVYITDDAGNITTLEQKNIDQLDKC